MVTKRVIALAIGLLHPGMTPQVRDQYAAVLFDGQQSGGFDGLTAVALIEHESRWHPSARSPDSHYAGLGQIACATEARCQELLDGMVNARMIGSAAKSWRTTCRSMTNVEPTATGLLIAYGGFSQPGEWCGLRRTKKGWFRVSVPKRIKEVLAIRRQLVRQLPRTRGTR